MRESGWSHTHKIQPLQANEIAEGPSSYARELVVVLLRDVVIGVRQALRNAG